MEENNGQIVRRHNEQVKLTPFIDRPDQETEEADTRKEVKKEEIERRDMAETKEEERKSEEKLERETGLISPSGLALSRPKRDIKPVERFVP